MVYYSLLDTFDHLAEAAGSFSVAAGDAARIVVGTMLGQFNPVSGRTIQERQFSHPGNGNAMENTIIGEHEFNSDIPLKQSSMLMDGVQYCPASIRFRIQVCDLSDIHTMFSDANWYAGKGSYNAARAAGMLSLDEGRLAAQDAAEHAGYASMLAERGEKLIEVMQARAKRAVARS